MAVDAGVYPIAILCKLAAQQLSLLVALFVAPVLVFVGQAIGQPIDLNFNTFEVIALVIAVMVTNLISFGGRSNWLDGTLLLATYLILGVAFYYHPA